MKSVAASLLVVISFFFTGGVFAESIEQQTQTISQAPATNGSAHREQDASCLVAGERCPACCTNNCKDCSGCKPQALETQS